MIFPSLHIPLHLLLPLTFQLLAKPHHRLWWYVFTYSSHLSSFEFDSCAPNLLKHFLLNVSVRLQITEHPTGSGLNTNTMIFLINRPRSRSLLAVQHLTNDRALGWSQISSWPSSHGHNRSKHPTLTQLCEGIWMAQWTEFLLLTPSCQNRVTCPPPEQR